MVLSRLAYTHYQPGGLVMASRGRFLKVLSLLLIVALFLAACERPLQTGDEESAEATAIAESEAETPTEEAETGEVTESTTVESETETQVETTAETEVEPAPTEEPTEELNEPAETTEPAEVVEEVQPTATAEPVPTGEMAAEVEATEPAEAATVDPNVGGGAPGATAEGTPEATTGSESEVVAEDQAETVTGETTQAQAATPTAQPTPLPATHTVAPGENLYRIGLMYGMSWVTLAQYNNLPNPNYVYVGQVLKIPGGTTPPTQPPTEPDSPNYTNYVVKPGDTLFKISRAFGVSPDAIAEANGIVNPNLIYAGQVLKIPTAAPETPPQTTHTVNPGETLYKISLQYGVHWLAIAQANHLSSPYIIYPGQTLVIPSG